MLPFWLDIAAFALKALLIVGSVGAVALIIAITARGEREESSEIEVKSLDERYEADEALIRTAVLDKKERKAFRKARKAASKAAKPDKRLYVLRFKGDMAASSVGRLGREIDAVLSVARAGVDEVVTRLDSPGGTVTGYGLAAAELRRIVNAKIVLTVCVDQVAASGGYMMACVADRILAAPFALIGSIGVVAQIPNVNRLLKKNDIDFEEITAGEFKRTVSVFGEITEAGREHFRGKLDETHDAFKRFVASCRPKVDVDKLGNGDVWLASEALEIGLVDEISTADDYLFRSRGAARLYEVSMQARQGRLRQWLLGTGAALGEAARTAIARFGASSLT
jgi:serine protease SohB